MKKELQILYKHKKHSTELYDSPRVEFDEENNFIVVADYIRGEKTGPVKYKYIFKHVFGFRYSCQPLCTSNEINAYDQIVEVLDSEWLKNFDKLDEEFTHTKKEELHHYMTYFDSEGVYEVIAKSFEVEEIKE